MRHPRDLAGMRKKVCAWTAPMRTQSPDEGMTTRRRRHGNGIATSSGRGGMVSGGGSRMPATAFGPVRVIGVGCARKATVEQHQLDADDSDQDDGGLNLPHGSGIRQMNSGNRKAFACWDGL